MLCQIIKYELSEHGKKFIPIYTDLMLKERMLKNDVLFGKSQK